jgi:lipopolysaccharide export LptBFGC system permease protein LptF
VATPENSDKKTVRREQYRKLEMRPAWRMVKVVYVVIAAVALVALMLAGARNAKNAGANVAGTVALTVVIYGAVFLGGYWLVRWICAYIFFGSDRDSD